MDIKKQRDYIDHVSTVLTERDILEALAEEAAELGQAALKMIRASGMSGNKTPKTYQEAIDALSEEVMDLCSCLLLINELPKQADVEQYEKWQRWAKRLGYQDDD